MRGVAEPAGPVVQVNHLLALIFVLARGLFPAFMSLVSRFRQFLSGNLGSFLGMDGNRVCGLADLAGGRVGIVMALGCRFARPCTCPKAYKRGQQKDAQAGA